MAAADIKSTVRIALVGDVHDQWLPIEADLLRGLGVDLVLFVGDFGNEAVVLVEQIAQLDLPKAIMFGNHDAWFSATHFGKQHCPYDRKTEDWVQRQIDAVGEDFVGYGAKDFPDLGVTVLGARPFSWGGPEWKNKSFYKDRFGLKGFEESADRIMEAVARAGTNHLIFIGHNGPAGLGSEAESPCGKDWGGVPGDYGDPDFALAIQRCQDLGKSLPLVGFGHMHHGLRHRKDVKRQSIAQVAGTVYVNAAAVPRILLVGDERRFNYSIVTLTDGVVTEVALTWVSNRGEVVDRLVSYGGLD
jgi:uncharacterized protein (TIGR04168 family)